MRTSKVVGIVLATNAAIMAVLLLALWSASSVAAVPSPVEQAGALDAHGSRPAQAAPTPVPGGPGYYSIDSVEMRPADSTIGYLNWGGLTTTQESTINPLTYTMYAAGLHLPQGARITKLVAYGYDDDEAKGFSFGVLRSTVNDTLTTEFVVPITGSDTDSSPFAKEVAADEDFATVDNSVYTYAVILEMGEANSGKELRLFMFRVDYTFDSYVPLAMKKYSRSTTLIPSPAILRSGATLALNRVEGKNTPSASRHCQHTKGDSSATLPFRMTTSFCQSGDILVDTSLSALRGLR